MAYLDYPEEVCKVRIHAHEFDRSDFDEIQIIESGGNKYIVIMHGKRYEIRLSHAELPRQYGCVINQELFEVTLIRNIDVQIEAMSFGHSLRLKTEVIKAPMPGLVKKVSVTVGEVVIKGQNLITLEAMKMENVIKSPQDGKIKSISAVPGAAVEKNQVLITF